MDLNFLNITKFVTTTAVLILIATANSRAAAGDLDPTFGTGGRVSSPGFFGNAIAIQPDGKIVVAGNGVERYNTDGSLDVTFGTAGRATIPVYSAYIGCGGSRCVFTPGSATAIAIQPNGKIIVAGSGQLNDDGDTYIAWAFAIARFNTDGSLDTSFGTGGQAVTLGSGEGGPRALAIQSDGKIVAAGYKRFVSWDFLTIRYNPGGTLDTTFGSGGLVSTSFGGIADEANDIAIQSDGKIVVAGQNRMGVFQGPFIFNFALARYDSDGSTDPSFGTGGKVVTPFGDTTSTVKQIGIQSDGKIVAAGTGGNHPNTGFALARYNAEGSLDNSFGTSGKALTLFVPGYGGAGTVAIQPDGKLIATGYKYEGNNSSIALVRNNADGSLDTTFGSGGKVFTPFGDISVGNDAAIQSDGKIVVLASTSYPASEYALFRYQGGVQSNFTVTRSDDRNNPACVPDDCSLREAVNAANASSTDDVISFAFGLTKITLASEIVINNAGGLTISGPGANVLTIDGGPGTNRIFYVNYTKATISGITLTGGNGTGAGISGNGGAISADGSSLILDGVNVTGNTSNGYGGGVYCFGNDARIINSAISGNSAGLGGGIGSLGAVVTIVNSTISANTSTADGGGVYTDFGDVTLRNVTITSNTAQQGGGIYSNDSEYPVRAYVNLGNSIVAGNTATTGRWPEIWCHAISPVKSAGGNLIGDSPGDSTNTGFAIAYKPTDIRDTDPMLAALADNGGTTPTHPLLPASPAFDKGLNNLVSPLASVFDQRGPSFARIRDGNGDGIATVDIGAYEVQLGSTGHRPTTFDFDDDGRADIAFWRDTNGIWSVKNSSSGAVSAFQFGSNGDRIVPGDYDGDGRNDYAVWRPSTGIWYLQQSTAGFRAFQFGVSTDLPTQGDFDGDGKTDIAVFRPSTGTWYLQQSTDGFAATQFGLSGDKPVAGDYDGDGKADLAVYRPSDGTWYLWRSLLGFSATQFGISADKVVPADYDGDGKTDIAVYRDGSPGVWYLLQSTGGYIQVNFGSTGDIPVPADYDGDGRADVAVFRPSNATWYLLQSTSGFDAASFGQSGDKSVPSGSVPIQ